MEFDDQVTAISASLYADNLAFIATEDGTLHVWDADGLQTGTGTGANAQGSLRTERWTQRHPYRPHEALAAHRLL